MENDLDDHFQKKIATFDALDLATFAQAMKGYPDAPVQERIIKLVLGILDNGSTQLPTDFEEKRASFESAIEELCAAALD